MLIETQNLIESKNSLESKTIPLRTWTSDWSVPKNVRIKRYISKQITSHKTEVKINRYALWGKIERAKQFIERTYKDNPKQWGKGKKSGRRFEYNTIGNNVWIKILAKCPFFSIKHRNFYFVDRYLKMSLCPQEIGLWYLSGEGQVRFAILPKFIDLKEEFFELIGILDGEMCKKISRGGGSSIKISNAEPTIIKHIIKQFKEVFNIHPDSWNISLILNNKNLTFKKEDDQNLKNFWSKKIGVPLNNFTKTTFQNEYSSDFSKYGIIQIRHSNSLFFNTLLDIMKNIRSIILKNRDYCCAYMRGLAAAEGGIGKRKGENKLRMIHIGGTNEEDKIFYLKVLSKLGITSMQKYKLRIEVYGLKNFIKLYKINIFKHHPSRRKNFLSALKNLNKSNL